MLNPSRSPRVTAWLTSMEVTLPLLSRLTAVILVPAGTPLPTTSCPTLNPLDALVERYSVENRVGLWA